MTGQVDELSGTPDRMETIVIGGGQSGLAVGYHLMRHGRPFVILDANERTGDTWRRRGDGKAGGVINCPVLISGEMARPDDPRGTPWNCETTWTSSGAAGGASPSSC